MENLKQSYSFEAYLGREFFLVAPVPFVYPVPFLIVAPGPGHFPVPFLLIPPGPFANYGIKRYTSGSGPTLTFELIILINYVQHN